MSGKRWAVLDKDGKVINHIMIKDPVPKGYWPGYGAWLCPLEPVDTSGGGGGLDIVDFKFEKQGIPQIGDTVNLETGEVTRFVPELKPDPITQEICASAPDVKMATDAEPKPDGGTVVVKGGGKEGDGMSGSGGGK